MQQTLLKPQSRCGRHSFGAVTNTPVHCRHAGAFLGQVICSPVELAALCGSLRTMHHFATSASCVVKQGFTYWIPDPAIVSGASCHVSLTKQFEFSSTTRASRGRCFVRSLEYRFPVVTRPHCGLRDGDGAHHSRPEQVSNLPRELVTS